MYHIQPVYTDEEYEDEDTDVGSMRRASSCPDLSMYRSQSPPQMRKRAKSVFYPGDSDLLRSGNDRVHSESDLSRIDRKRTFDESNPLSRPTDILAQVVTALGAINISSDDEESDSEMEGGIHGFSDSQILASEKTGSGWSLSYSDGSTAVPPWKERTRAASDFRAPVHLYDNDEHKWTWSANNSQIKEFMRLRKINNKKKDTDLYRASFAYPKPQLNGHSVTINVIEPGGTVEPISPGGTTNKSLFNILNPFKKRSPDDRRLSLSPDQAEIQRYLDRTNVGRNTRKSISRKSVAPKQFLTTPAKRRASTFSTLSTADENSAEILENTTIADLIRALEVAHTRANTLDTPLLQEYFDVPKRKLGTAGLTPPTGLPPLLGIFPSADHGRRGSMKPTSTQTPIFGRANMARRQSNVLDIMSAAQRRPSLRPPSNHPPPYSAPTPKIAHRRFSVRPTNLTIPPGQAPMPLFTPSKQATSGVQRKLSMIPSPLAREPSLGMPPQLRSSVRFVRTSSSTSGGNVTPTFTGTPMARKRGSIFRPAAQAPPTRTRHGSLAHIFQRNGERKRSESK